MDGTEYEINADHRTCLEIILAFEDNSLTFSEKQEVLLLNLYKEIPDNTLEAIIQGNKFLNFIGSEESEIDEDEDPGFRVYSFNKDAALIFSAFRQTHGIDLETATMHWWKFTALFMDLGGNTTFCNLISLRHRVKSGKATKEEKEQARAMGKIFDLPEFDDRTLEERDAEEAFMKMVNNSRKAA